MIRITGGEWRGRRLCSPTGLRARPTLGSVREAIFSILSERLGGARALDLFAGAGALGFEALSRGAQSCRFIDRARAHLDLIGRSARALGCEDRVERLRADLPRALERPEAGAGAFDLVFMDPPYESGLAAPTLRALAQGPWLAPRALVVIETRRGEAIDAPAGYELVRHKRYGDTEVHIYTMPLNEKRHHQALELMPGGVNSPVRAFGAVGGTPRYIASGQGAMITDLSGKRYIDYVGSWGPLILGHAHPAVVAAVTETARKGLSFGAPTDLEVQLAERVFEDVPSVEMVRMVNSGTEATMSALRLARAATGRDKIIKFAGGYHGHVDSLLVKAGSGATTFGAPSSPGVPASVAADTLVCRYNDAASVEATLAQHAGQVAAVIVEPVAGNMGCIPPREGFLEALRELTIKHGALLIYDEVMTGFRVALGGAQERYDQNPDLSTFGKILGGGLPVGAYGGRRELMELVSPSGSVYQAGTLSGNPLTMAAGLATLKEIEQPGVYDRLEALSARLEQGLRDRAGAAGVPVHVTRVGSMIGLFFTGTAVQDYDDALRCDAKRYATFFHAMLDRGVYLAPSAFETLFVSLAHTEDLIDRTLEAADQCFHLL